MKFIALIALTLSATAMARVSSRLVKVLDGTTAICATKADTIKYVNGAYRLSNQKVSIVDNKLKISLKADFFQCGEFDRSIGFKNIGFTETFEQAIYSTARGIDTATITTNAADLRFFRDGVYTIISKIDVSGVSPTVSTEFALSDLLTADELAALDAGKEVKTSVDTVLTKRVNFRSAEADMNNPIHFGAFRTLMTIKSVNGVISAALR